MSDKNRAYKILVVEDEELAIDLLKGYISELPHLYLKDIAMNGKDAQEKLLTSTYDIVLMDIDIPILSGIEVLESIEEPPYIIFTTSSNKYAVKAFELRAVDYLVKPFGQKRFDKAVEKAIESIKKQDTILMPNGNLGLSFKEEGTRYIIDFKDILYFSSNARHSIIHTEEKDYETPQSLGLLEQKLPLSQFMRIHKRYVVNLTFVSRIKTDSTGQYSLILKDEDHTPLPLGRTYVSSLKELLG